MQATTFTHAELEKLVLKAASEQAEIALDDPNFVFRASLIVDQDGKVGAMVSIRQIVTPIDPQAE